MYAVHKNNYNLPKRKAKKKIFKKYNKIYFTELKAKYTKDLEVKDHYSQSVINAASETEEETEIETTSENKSTYVLCLV